jgi:branched-subunit amino acid transport protein AzlD
MLDTIFTLFFTGWVPYHIYKSLKREKLSHCIAGITSSMILFFLFICTHPPINLDHERALGLLAISIAALLFYAAQKKKKKILFLSALILAAFGTYIFSSHYL